LNTITMVDLRKHAKEVVERAQHGERMLLLYRGNPAMVLEPYREEEEVRVDPLFALSSMEGESLTNEQVDEVLYG